MVTHHTWKCDEVRSVVSIRQGTHNSESRRLLDMFEKGLEPCRRSCVVTAFPQSWMHGRSACSHDLYGRIRWQSLPNITDYRLWRHDGGCECVARKRSRTVPVAVLIHSSPAPTRFQHPIPNRAEAWCEVGAPGSKGCSRVSGPAALTPVI